MVSYADNQINQKKTQSIKKLHLVRNKLGKNRGKISLLLNKIGKNKKRMVNKILSKNVKNKKNTFGVQ